VGSVLVESPAETVLTFAETGTWQTRAGRETRFTNAYRWTAAGPDRVRLEHLRFGPEHPVYLFDLTCLGGGVWSSAGPHQGREDCYTAELRLRDRGMQLGWVVSGPKKQEGIDYEYHWGDGSGAS